MIVENDQQQHVPQGPGSKPPYRYSPEPSVNGLGLWTEDVALCNQSFTPSAGVQYARRINTPEGFIPSKVWLAVSTAASGATSAAGVYLGLAKQNGTLIATTADMASLVTSGGPKNQTPTAVSGQSLLSFPGGRDTYLWGLFLITTQSTTNLVLRGPSNSSTALNAGLTAAPYRAGSTGSGLSALQSFDPTALAVASGAWIGVS